MILFIATFLRCSKEDVNIKKSGKNACLQVFDILGLV